MSLLEWYFFDNKSAQFWDFYQRVKEKLFIRDEPKNELTPEVEQTTILFLNTVIQKCNLEQLDQRLCAMTKELCGHYKSGKCHSKLQILHFFKSLLLVTTSLFI